MRVVNVGDDDARVSITRYWIGSTANDVETPAIAKGFFFLIANLEVPPGLQHWG